MGPCILWLSLKVHFGLYLNINNVNVFRFPNLIKINILSFSYQRIDADYTGIILPAVSSVLVGLVI